MKTLKDLCFIKETYTQHTGGGCMVDFVELKNGKVLGISDELVVLYDSFEDFDNDIGEDRQHINLIDEEGNQR